MQLCSTRRKHSLFGSCFLFKWVLFDLPPAPCLCAVQPEVVRRRTDGPCTTSTTGTTTTTTTPSAHLCSLEAGRGVVSGVSASQVGCESVCVFGGVGGRWACWMREESFWADNLLIDGLGWVGRGSPRRGVCGWRLPSTCPPAARSILSSSVVRGVAASAVQPSTHSSRRQRSYARWTKNKKNLSACVRACTPDYRGLTAGFTRESSLSVLCLCVTVTLPQWSGSFLPLQHSTVFLHSCLLCFSMGEFFSLSFSFLFLNV